MREKSLKIIQPRVICSARQFSSLSPVRYLRNPSLFPNRNIESGRQPKAFVENPSPSFKLVTLRKSGVFFAFLLGNLTQENQRVLCLCTVSWSVLVARKILVSFLQVKCQMIAEYSRDKGFRQHHVFIRASFRSNCLDMYTNRFPPCEFCR